MIAFFQHLTDSEGLLLLCAFAFALFFWGFLFRTRL